MPVRKGPLFIEGAFPLRRERADEGIGPHKMKNRKKQPPFRAAVSFLSPY